MGAAPMPPHRTERIEGAAGHRHRRAVACAIFDRLAERFVACGEDGCVKVDRYLFAR
jgi:hypothetical protein